MLILSGMAPYVTMLESQALSCVDIMNDRMDSNREMAINAVDILNDLIGDFVSGTLVLSDYYRHHKIGTFRRDQMISVQKMCLSNLVLSFAKLLEFWSRFHEVVPNEHRAVLKELNRNLIRRGVVDFRNKIVGHIWDNDLGRPLGHSEIMARLATLTGGDLTVFLRWVNNPEGNTYPRTVLGVIETLRDSLVDAHGIQPSEVIDR